MPHSDPKTVVSTAWLAKKLDDPNLRIIDASWYLPSMGRDGRSEYDTAHIPGARFFDIDTIADQDTDLPHMVPPIEMFVSRMQAMGLSDGNQVVVYDGMGLMSAARVWWLFRLMGKSDIAVLEGGLPKWQAEGHSVTDVVAPAKGRHFTVDWQGHMVRDAAQVLAAKNCGILDARSLGRFRGVDPEPRVGLRLGHIPGSRSVCFLDLLENGVMKSPDALRDVFAQAGVDLNQHAITTCGSGVTAAVISLALERIGHRDHSLYDGSWSEWGLPGALPVATGE